MQVTALATSSADQDNCNVERSVDGRSSQAAPVKPRITVFTRFYPPAYLGGGPARSVHALVEALAGDFRFSVVTSAFDADVTTEPMKSIEPCRWSTRGPATIWYESRQRMIARTTARLIRQTEPQLLFLNSLFDYRFTILPLLIARTVCRKVPVVLAPRGELSAGALSLKRQKKHSFIVAFRLLKLHKAVIWRASTSREKADIERVFGIKVKCHIAGDLRAGLFSDEVVHRPSRLISDDPRSGSLVFFSRIVPKKNVATAIRAMQLVRGNAYLSIAGPIEDTRYWDQCLQLINDMPDPRRVSYVGTIPPDEVVGFLNRFDLFVFPTLGENFGHVILESLAAGTPVIVGSDTPWQHVETSGAGWVCDPTKPEAIAELIENFLGLDKDAHMRMRAAARELALRILSDPSGVNAYRSMFRVLTSSESS